MATDREKGAGSPRADDHLDIGVVAPWPPDRTGIADYVRILVTGLLRAGDRATVYAATAEPAHLPGVDLRPLGDAVEPEAGHDVLVYHIGNHCDFHLSMLPLIAHTGGLVHLHDIVLQHLVGGYHVLGQTDRYLDAVERWHGASLRDCAAAAIDAGTAPWESSSVGETPLVEEALRHADGVLVHSEHARRAVEARLPHLPVELVPQRYADGRARDRHIERDHVEIVVAGSIQANRRIDILLDAVIDLDRPDVVLRLVGPVADDLRPLVDRTAAILGDRVAVEGFVPDERLVDAIAGADLVVNLREPTMGETSAICIRALELGTPLLVTDAGWYAELPDAVHKLAPGSGPEAVREVIESLADDNSLRAAWRVGAAEVAGSLPTLSESVDRYRAALRSLLGSGADRTARSSRGAQVRHYEVGAPGLEITGIGGFEPRAVGVVAEVGDADQVIAGFDLDAPPGATVWVIVELDLPPAATDLDGLEVRLDGRVADVGVEGNRLVARATIPERTPPAGDRHLMTLYRRGGLALPPFRAVRAVAGDPPNKTRRRLEQLSVRHGDVDVPLLEHDLIVLGLDRESGRGVVAPSANAHLRALVAEDELQLASLLSLKDQDRPDATLLAGLATELARGSRPVSAVVVVSDPLTRARRAAARWAERTAESGPAPDVGALRARILRELRRRLGRPHPLEAVAPELLAEPGPLDSGWLRHRRGSLEVTVLDGHRPECWDMALESLGVETSTPAPTMVDAESRDRTRELALPRDALDSAYDPDEPALRAASWCCGAPALRERYRTAVARHRPPPPPRHDKAGGALEDLRYLEALHDWEGGHDRGPLAAKEVLVYAMPKTGTVTLFHSISKVLREERGWFIPEHHALHNHNNFLLRLHSRCLDGTVPVSLGDRTVVSDIVRYRSLVGHPTLVATSHREPLARAISHLFHWAGNQIEKKLPTAAELGGARLVAELAKSLRRQGDVPSPLEEVVPTFFDDHKMDHGLGACVVDLEQCRVLTLPLERIDDWAEAIGAALDRGPVEVLTSNQAADKPIAAMYREFTSRLVVPREVIDHLHDGDTRAARYVHWYYDAATREELRAKLLERYGPRPGADLVLDADVVCG